MSSASLSNSIARSPFYTLSLHDALPISRLSSILVMELDGTRGTLTCRTGHFSPSEAMRKYLPLFFPTRLKSRRSEEHTSELQTPCNLVCRLLLEKKKHKIRLASYSD